jgi:DNA replication protein DnaC
MLELPPPPDGVRTLTNPELARLRERFPRVPSSPRQCPTCRGKGSFRWWSYDGGRREIAEYRCNCEAQWLMHLFLLNANVGDSYQRLSWGDMDGVEQGALEKVEAYLNRAEAFVQNGVGMILYGGKGTGKSLLANTILKTLLGKGYGGYFTTFSDMLDIYASGWRDPDEKKWFDRQVRNAEVLVVDDLGREYQGRQQTDLPRASLDSVFRHRIAAGTPTIFTTNLDMTKVHDTYGEHVLSLMRERSSTYQFTGSDYRDVQRLRLIDEIEQGLTRPVVMA